VVLGVEFSCGRRGPWEGLGKPARGLCEDCRNSNDDDDDDDGGKENDETANDDGAIEDGDDGGPVDDAHDDTEAREDYDPRQCAAEAKAAAKGAVKAAAAASRAATEAWSLAREEAEAFEAAEPRLDAPAALSVVGATQMKIFKQKFSPEQVSALVSDAKALKKYAKKHPKWVKEVRKAWAADEQAIKEAIPDASVLDSLLARYKPLLY